MLAVPLSLSRLRAVSPSVPLWVPMPLLRPPLGYPLQRRSTGCAGSRWQAVAPGGGGARDPRSRTHVGV